MTIMSNTTSTTCAPKRERTALEIASARARQLGLALAPLPVPTPAATPTQTETRETFYIRKNAASRRTARKEFNCQQFGCFALVREGETYLDTRETTHWPATKRICIKCAETAV